MTLGLDVSRLFPDMIMACNARGGASDASNNLVIKKMVYLYLTNYAQSNSELTLLVINTLQKDCRDEDPMIRGLALRSLSSLRLRSILEYVVTPLKAGLSDSSGYVRQAAVMGVLKVFHLSPELVKDSDMIDELYRMIRDREPQVVVNALMSLNEMLAEEGGVVINQAIIGHLLARLREFSDWGQCIILELLCKYDPANEDELFGIMNLLDTWLRVANSAVVLATVKTFIKLTNSVPEVQRQVYLRLKTPILTLMASASSEISYAVLAHVAIVVDRAPGVFDDEFKQFFCKFQEPSCVKSLKMGVLPKVANAMNSREIVAELVEYVSGVDSELSRLAVRAIGEIGIRVPPSSEAVAESLLELIEMEAEYVRAETVIVMQDILRKYPERAPGVIPSLHRCLKRMEDPSGKAAVVWMIGEYGQLIDDAPYLLEPLIDGIKDEESVLVRCELLTATLKLFFKRPPEVQKMMGRLLKTCLTENVNKLVHDRALLYFRLLRANVREAALVIGGERSAVSEYAEEVAPEIRDKIFSEFNTLSVVYGKPSEEFISKDHLIAAPPLDATAKGAQTVSSARAADDDRLLTDEDGAGQTGGGGGGGGGGAPEVDLLGDDLLGLGSPAPAPVPVPQQSTTAASASSFGGFGGFGSLLGGFGGSAAAPTPTPAIAPPAVSIVPVSVLDPQSFQSKWGSLAISQQFQLRALRIPSTDEISALLKSSGVQTIASGDTGMHFKFYVYAQDSMGSFHCIEMLLEKSNGAISATVKSDLPANSKLAVQALTNALRIAQVTG
jgi:vesicle coat complex subunit